jgi:hypothetical protein
VAPASPQTDTTRLRRWLGFVPVTDLDDVVARQARQSTDRRARQTADGPAGQAADHPTGQAAEIEAVPA